jgi:hypothetical protein
VALEGGFAEAKDSEARFEVLSAAFPLTAESVF